MNPEVIATIPADTAPLVIPRLPSSIVKNPWELKLLRLRVVWDFIQISRERHGNLWSAVKAIRQLKKKYRQIFGEDFISKVMKVDGRYFWRMGGPGFPSEASHRMHANEVNRVFPRSPYSGQRTIIMAITKRCPLNCEHCSEWHHLSSTEAVTVEEWIQVVRTFQQFGTTQIMLSGGEPMVRVKDIYKLLDSVGGDTEFWVITSGVGFRARQARELKAHGLTGVMVSIDDHREAGHDRFRGYSGAFRAAISALVEARKAGLVTTMSLCATKEYTTRENLEAYLQLARQLGVAFVQLLEPRAVGRYAGLDVDLSAEQLALLEEMYHLYNNHPDYSDFPIVDYLGYHQRRVGCFGGGNRFFYIDTDGDAHTCPFCTGKVVSTLNRPAEEVIDELRRDHCHAFAEAEI